MNPPNVLIISDEPDFARTLMARWHAERSEPTFTLMSSDLWNGPNDAQYDVAIVGPIRSGRLTPILKALDTPIRPTVCVLEDGSGLRTLRDMHPRVVAVRQIEGWVDAVVGIVTEGIRRVEAQSRAKKAEQAAMLSQQHAALGRYMLEMRHNLNNALTSVLGNAELLMMQPGSLPQSMRDQLETIRAMSLRIHEVMQRFSSLEAEMHCSERQSLSETKSASQTFVSGT